MDSNNKLHCLFAEMAEILHLPHTQQQHCSTVFIERTFDIVVFEIFFLVALISPDKFGSFVFPQWGTSRRSQKFYSTSDSTRVS